MKKLVDDPVLFEEQLLLYPCLTPKDSKFRVGTLIGEGSMTPTPQLPRSGNRRHMTSLISILGGVLRLSYPTVYLY